ncbi:MAG: hypothetical protein H7Y13_16340 [Sphingobacteriaceae bacterium]|nr:hypothetical protein [Sphingobacteriaceae bacterium]
MKNQNHSNFRQYYYPHHLIFYPLCLILCGICIYQTASTESELKYIYALLSLIILLITWLSFMTRQHYALKGQDRIIRLELRLRYFQLTNQRLEPIEEKLSFSQLAALRFASDEELPMLIKRSIDENLLPDTIRKSIKNWLPDHMRV